MALDKWAEALNSSSKFEISYRTKRADGSYHLCVSCAAAMKNSDEGTIEWVGSTFDIDRFVNLPVSQSDQFITGAQVRGGRGILNWSVQQLADRSGLSVSLFVASRSLTARHEAIRNSW